MDRRVKIVDVARAAGTSIASASVALNGKPGVSPQTRSRILAVAEELGYRPDSTARRLRNERTHLLGVTFAIDMVFHSELVGHLYEAAGEAGWDLVLSGVTPTRPVERAVESLLRDRCEAVLLISPDMTDDALAALSRQTSAVALGAAVSVAGVDSARSDDRAGAALAVDHLVGLGHRDIAYVDAGPAALNSERRAGYEAAMWRHALGTRIRVLAAAPQKGGPVGEGLAVTEAAGAAVAEALLADGDLPTALVTYNDMLAVGIMLSLRGRGVRIPGDMSVIGYDDTHFARLDAISLTSVRQDGQRLAQAAVNCALARAEGRERPGGVARIVVPPHLVVRSTTSTPRP